MAADLEHSIVCCAARRHVIIISCIFFLTFLIMVGAFIYQCLQPAIILLGTSYFSWGIVIPIIMLNSAISTISILGCNGKFMLIICAVVLIIQVGTTAYNIYEVFYGFELSAEMAKVFILYYTVPIGSAIYILGSAWCLLVLICLICCARDSGGRDVDIYDLESSKSQNETSSISEYDEHKHVIN